jgi:hypothetical protein
MKEKFNRTEADIKDYKIRLAKEIITKLYGEETISGFELDCMLLASQVLLDYDLDPYWLDSEEEQ